MHLLSGLYCYLMCFWIVLLMKHWKSIFPRSFSRPKTPDNMSGGKLCVIQELFTANAIENTVNLSLTASHSYL